MKLLVTGGAGFKNIKHIAPLFDIGRISRVAPLGNGLINETYLVSAEKGEFVLQKLHPIFKFSLLADIYRITRYLSDNNFITPILVKTRKGRLGIKNKDSIWRMMTYVPGKCFEGGITPEQAFSAAYLLGRFHNILSGLNYGFKHRLPNFHDTDLRIADLKTILDEYRGTKKYKELFSLSEKILKYYESLNLNLFDLPKRNIHGDLKINNVMFDKNGEEAVCLLDLDTMGEHSVAIDLGDAARTWCNSGGNEDAKSPEFNFDVLEAMIKGYLTTARFITKSELQAIPGAIELIFLEVASRFVADAFRESYFKLKSKYPNLYEQNKLRAETQIKLYENYSNKKERALKLINKLCKQ